GRGEYGGGRGRRGGTPRRPRRRSRPPRATNSSRRHNSASLSRLQSARRRRGTITPIARISQSQKRKRVVGDESAINLTHRCPHSFLTCVFPTAISLASSRME